MAFRKRTGYRSGRENVESGQMESQMEASQSGGGMEHSWHSEKEKGQLETGRGKCMVAAVNQGGALCGTRAEED